MGTSLVDDISWVCDKCNKPIAKGNQYRPDPNSYEAYHQECKP